MPAPATAAIFIAVRRLSLVERMVDLIIFPTAVPTIFAIKTIGLSRLAMNASLLR